MDELVGDKDRNQWFTPVWAAETLGKAHFDALGPEDFVVEPTAGTGNFLKAIPHDVRAIGVELDPALARAAELASGRQVINGDFTKVALPETPTAVIGNPPFELRDHRCDSRSLP